MSLIDRVRSTRNSVDFALRRMLTFGFRVERALPQDRQFQTEMEIFFSRFDWCDSLKVHSPAARLKILDVGARNFCLAPVFHALFSKHNFDPEIHGIEIDGFRRLSNFRTRRDYARYFAEQVSGSFFHVGDFLSWKTEVDCIFALNPFVTKSPLLAWGLPLKHFQPESYFEKITRLLVPGRGILFVTNPTKEEAAITRRYLQGNFSLLEEQDWYSQVGNHPRYGGLYRRVSETELVEINVSRGRNEDFRD